MQKPVLVVGAGIGGLMAAAELVLAQVPVVVLEAQAGPGGKMRREPLGPLSIDVGPTVLTMRHVFDDLFERAHERLEDYVTLQPQTVLARHFWPDGTTLDLYPDVVATSDAIDTVFGAEAAAGYRDFAQYAEKLYEVAQEPFIYAPRPTFAGALWHFGWRALSAAKDMDSRRTMNQALHTFFPHTPKLRQLFGRYATYTGASPYQAPATLNLISHVERQGVWAVQGGLSRLAEALAAFVVRHGGVLRYGAPVARVLAHAGRAQGVQLTCGEEIMGSAVVLNADVKALAQGALWPEGAADQGEAQAEKAAEPALSAVVMGLWVKNVTGPLMGHNVFFRRHGAQGEFDALFAERRMVSDPSIYVYAVDRAENDVATTFDHERVFALINAPAGMPPLNQHELASWQSTVIKRLEAAGIHMTVAAPPVLQQPHDFAQRFPGSRGALYGPPPHHWRGFFTRSGSRSALAGQYLTGGTVHPGAGVPMAALSGRLAARALLEDAPSMPNFPTMAMAGGTSMPTATTASTH